MVTLFIEIYAKPKNRGWEAVRATFRKFASLDDKPIGDITRADVVKVLDGIAANRTPIAANRAMSAIKKLFAWSLDRGVISVHPLVGLRKPGIERSRDRVLTDEELKSFWLATEDLGFPFGPAIQLMALTGQRRGERCSRIHEPAVAAEKPGPQAKYDWTSLSRLLWVKRNLNRKPQRNTLPGTAAPEKIERFVPIPQGECSFVRDPVRTI